MQPMECSDSFASYQQETCELMIESADDALIRGVVELASTYPYPHSVLGGSGAELYVRKLAKLTQYQGEGWYALRGSEGVVAAAHLSIYGVGNGVGHTLWKIRHPLIASGYSSHHLAQMFIGLTNIALDLRPGTAKFVIFLGQHEQEAMSQARRAGFESEARFKDYYRLGEDCFVYGKTIRTR